MTPFQGVTPEGKKFAAEFTKNSGQMRYKRCGVTPSRGVTLSESNKNDSDEHRI